MRAPRGLHQQTVLRLRHRSVFLLALIGVFLWEALPGAALWTHVPPAHRGPAYAGLPWLVTDAAHRIADLAGDAVQLHGFNDSALLEKTVDPAPLDARDAHDIAAMGFDVVRLPVAWSRLEPQRGQWDEAYLQQVADDVALLNRDGLYVVLDMHFLDFGPRWDGSGAPQWAALPLIPDIRFTQGDWGRHLSPAQNAAMAYFWLSPDWQADFMHAWQRVAARFADDSGVAGYDLYNEPHALPIPPLRFERDWMWPLYARTIDAIGAVDPNHLFFVEGELFGDFPTMVDQLSAPDLVYSPHEYTGSLVPPLFNGDVSALRDHVASVTTEAREVPAAMWVGEWGKSRDEPMAAQWVDGLLDAYDDAGAGGWAWWQWRQDGGWGMRNAAGTSTDWKFLLHLARPYLVSAPPGVRLAGHGDGVHGTLDVAVAAHSTVETVVLGWAQQAFAGPPVITGSCALEQQPSADGRLGLLIHAGSACTIHFESNPEGAASL